MRILHAISETHPLFWPIQRCAVAADPRQSASAPPRQPLPTTADTSDTVESMSQQLLNPVAKSFTLPRSVSLNKTPISQVVALPQPLTNLQGTSSTPMQQPLVVGRLNRISSINFETLPHSDLLAVAHRSSAELNLKNKILHDLKEKQNWLVCELAALNEVNANTDIAIDKSDVLSELLTHPDAGHMDAFKLDILRSLLQFRSELKTAKDTIERQEAALLEISNKRSIAEEEASFLRSMIDARRRNPNMPTTDLENRRIAELETRLRETSEDLVKVQSKVKQWAYASKRNQEGRTIAEACQSVIEKELAQTRSQLVRAKETEETLRKRIADERENATHVNADPSKITELQEILDKKEVVIADLEEKISLAQSRIADFEQSMQEAYNTVDTLEREALSLQEQNVELDRQNQMNDDRIEQLSNDLNMLLKKNGAAQTEIMMLKENNTTLSDNLVSAESRAEAAERQVESLNAAATEAADAAAAASSQHANEVDARTKKLEELDAKIHRKQAELDRLSQMEGAAVVSTVPKVEVSSADDGGSDLDKATLQTRVDQLTHELAERDKLISKLRNDITLQKSISQENMQEIERYEAEAASLRGIIDRRSDQDNVSGGTNLINSQLKDSVEKITTLEERLSVAQDEMMNLQASFHTERHRASQLAEENEQYLNKITRLSERLAAADTERRMTLDPASQQASADILKIANEQVEELRASLANQEEQVKTAYGKVAELLSEKSRMADRISELEESCQILQMQVRQLAEQRVSVNAP